MRNTAIWSAVVAGAATASVLGLAGEVVDLAAQRGGPGARF